MHCRRRCQRGSLHSFVRCNSTSPAADAAAGDDAGGRGMGADLSFTNAGSVITAQVSKQLQGLRMPLLSQQCS